MRLRIIYKRAWNLQVTAKWRDHLGQVRCETRPMNPYEEHVYMTRWLADVSLPKVFGSP